MQPRVCCIGKGIVSAAGKNVKEFEEALYKRISGINKISCVDTRRMNVGYDAEVKSISHEDKLYIMAEQALFEALKEANIGSEVFRNNDRVGLVFGSSLGDTMVHKRYIQSVNMGYKNNQSLLPLTINYTGKRLYNQLQIKGPFYSVSNTCVTGINVISLGYHLLSTNQVDLCIVGCAEVLNEFIFAGMDSLKALSQRDVLEPFSAERDGIILGEGAGFLVLTTKKKFIKDNACAFIEGFAITNDAVHLTAPDIKARSMILAIEQSLDMAKINAGEIDCIFCCGTGTKYNDAMQALAIHKVWSKYFPDIPITTIKPIIGHTLGASGVIESVGILIMMEQGWITPIGEKYDYDPNIHMLPLLHQLLFKRIEKAILLSTGFTGVNGALIIGKGYQ